MRGGLLALAVLIAAATAALSTGMPRPGAEDVSDLQRAQEDAQKAYRAHDYKAYLEAMRRLVALAPRSSRALYALASAQALNGAKADAAATLERLAGLGLGFDPAGDPDFAGVKDAPELQPVFEKLQALRAPFGTSEPAFRLPDKDMVEGVARDPKTGAFFVSSVWRRRIVRVAADGTAAAFVPEGRDGLYSVIALAVDPERRALWATSDATPWMKDGRPEEEGRSALVEYDVDTGRLRRRFEPPASATGAHLSDMTVGPKGEVMVADPYTGRVFVLAPGAAALEVRVAPGTLRSPQGMAWSADGRWLFVADYALGIARLDPRDGSVVVLPAPEDAFVNGIDGLALAGDSLVGVQNGATPNRIVRLRLDPAASRIVAVTVVERANPRWEEPTLGTVVGRDFYYVGTSQYGKFEGKTIDEARIEPPVIFRTHLDW
jgi:streptogramin lyase